jgi:hypothetical protein
MRNILEVLEDGPDVGQILIVAAVILIFGTVVGGGIWLKFGAPSSDFQRLNSLEKRVRVLERGSRPDAEAPEWVWRKYGDPSEHPEMIEPGGEVKSAPFRTPEGRKMELRRRAGTLPRVGNREVLD